MGMLNGISGEIRQLVRRRLDRAADDGPPFDIATYETLRWMRRWEPGDLILDVGANDGRTAMRLLRHLPQPQIHAFEPGSEPFAALTERTRGHDVTCHQLALGDVEEERTLYVGAESALGSLYPDWTDGGERRMETIRVSTIDRVVEQHDFDQIRLLKIDAEGHDLEVLKGAGRTLGDARIDIIQVEAGLGAPGKPQPTLSQFQELLAPDDYHLYAIHNLCRGRRLQPLTGDRSAPKVLVYCDALFVSARAEGVWSAA